MAEDDPDTPGAQDSGVPGLIDQYRQQRRAWLAQADELVRLRDEVRSAAEREAMDIVTAARRDVRQIVVEARRELMVLTAQLHAAMDAVEQSSAASALPLRSGDGGTVDTEATEAQSSLGVTRELVLGARREVRSVLDEARAEIEALASEAPVPFPALEKPPLAPEPPRIGRMFAEEPRPEETRIFGMTDSSRGDPVPDRVMTPISSALDESGIFAESSTDFSSFGEREVQSPFVSSVLAGDDDQRAPRARSAMTFVALFAAVGVLVTTGTVWWLFAGAGPEGREPEPRPAAVTSAPTNSGTLPIGNPTPLASGGTSSSLALKIEARRPSWIRTSIDGQADGGRLYQAGETKEIASARSVVIRAGDAGAVFVSLNGDQAQPLGADGAVITRRYTLDQTKASTAPTATAASANDRGESRPPVLTPPASPVTLAVENRGRSAATRADARPPATPAASNPSPGAANSPAREPASASPSSSARPDLVVAGQQWLDAYQRRDRQAMSAAGTDNITVTDERSTTERFPASQNGVQRELDQVELALTGDTALLTARMTERTDGAAASPHISRVSQIWVRRAGQWRLADVRIMAEARLNQIVR